MISKNQIKFVKSLQKKKFRLLSQCFVVESSKNVSEFLYSNYTIHEIYATKSWLDKNNLPGNFSINQLNRRELERISTLKTAPDVLAVVKIPKKEKKIDFTGINIVLDDIKDPGNLGTIIRTCDWFGVKNIYCSEETVDTYNSKVIQSSMGSIARVNIIYTDIKQMIKNINVKVYASVINGKDLSEIKVDENSLIIFGNESRGISKEIKNIASERITINKTGEAESLNVASAAAIILNKFCI